MAEPSNSFHGHWYMDRVMVPVTGGYWLSTAFMKVWRIFHGELTPQALAEVGASLGSGMATRLGKSPSPFHRPCLPRLICQG